MKKTLFGAALTVVVCLVACSSSKSSDDSGDHDAHASSFPSCEAIKEACHPLDVGAGPIHDCHEVAHESTSDEACAAKKDECLRTCVSSDASVSDAESPDGASSEDAGHDMDAEH